jgi:hypothetical protein
MVTQVLATVCFHIRNRVDFPVPASSRRADTSLDTIGLAQSKNGGV